MSTEETPSLASLRRGVSRRRGPSREGTGRVATATPSLFDLFSEPTAEPVPVRAPAADEPPQPSGKNSRQLEAATSASSQPAMREMEVTRTQVRVWSVAALVREIRGFVERNYGHVTVDGEISNWRPAASGHCYFTLKDGDAQMSAVMFRRNASLLRFRPKDGDAVRLRGQLSVYENRGQMQMIAESMELAGQGALLAAVQALKERLRREGLFDRKRPLPAFPKCIGVVTSLHGAALRDIVKVCRRRHAAVNLLIYPAAVQGPRCAQEIIAGLRWFSLHRDKADVLIVARGGGSWEDLHGFDDEGVVRAIAACPLPVISGVGHATDTTIADAAADVCAPTPSAAAELVTAAHYRIEERVERLHSRMLRAGRYEVLRLRQRFFAANADHGLRQAIESVRRREQHVDEVSFRIEAAMQQAMRVRQEQLARLEARLRKQDVAHRLAADRQRWNALSFQLQAAGKQLTSMRRQEAAHCESRLQALSPLRVLERGYALVYAANGTLLRDAHATHEGDVLRVRLAQGGLEVAVRNPN